VIVEETEVLLEGDEELIAVFEAEEEPEFVVLIDCDTEREWVDDTVRDRLLEGDFEDVVEMEGELVVGRAETEIGGVVELDKLEAGVAELLVVGEIDSKPEAVPEVVGEVEIEAGDQACVKLQI